MRLRLTINQIKMKRVIRNHYFRIAAFAVIILGSISLSFILRDISEGELISSTEPVVGTKSDSVSNHEKSERLPGVNGELPPVPVYGNGVILQQKTDCHPTRPIA